MRQGPRVGHRGPDVVGIRIAIGAVIAALLGGGVFLSNKLERDSRVRVAMLAAEAPTAADIRGQEQARERRAAFDENAFVAGAEQDAQSFELPPSEGAALSGAQAYAVELEEPVVLGKGRSWRSGHVEVRATIDKVAYQKLGATVSARHTIAEVKNISEVPIAYFARIRSHERGTCDVRGARMHNAMALLPGESAQIVICAGTGKIRIDRLEVLEISSLGYRYLSRVPARAAGHDSISASSHGPPAGVSMCETVDVGGLSQGITEGAIRWVDVVDFYSRHACDRYRFFMDYRYSPQAPARLPALPPEG